MYEQNLPRDFFKNHKLILTRSGVYGRLEQIENPMEVHVQA